MATGIHSGISSSRRTALPVPQSKATSRNKLKAFWAVLGKRGRYAAGAALVALVALGWGLRQTHLAQAPAQLFPYALNTSEVREVSDKLTEMHVAHELNVQKDNLMVAPAQVDGVRARLHYYGVPHTHPMPDDPKMFENRTVREQEVARLRSLEADLAESIRSLEGVQEARVTLAIPESTVFESDPKPTGSVLVTMLAGKELSGVQASGISHMVASAVPGLMPDQVQVLDSTGRTIQAREHEDAPQQALQKSLDQYLASSAQSLLDKALGAGNSALTVRAEYDFSQMEIRHTEEGGPGGGGAVVVEQKVTEGYHRGETPETTGEGQEMHEDGAKPKAQYEKVAEAHRIKPNERQVWTVHKLPRVRRLSCSVLLNAPCKGQVAAIRSAVKAAVGLDDSRGDQLEVAVLPFQSKAETRIGGGVTPLPPSPPAAVPSPSPLAPLGLLALGLVFLGWKRTHETKMTLEQQGMASTSQRLVDLSQTKDGRSNRGDDGETKSHLASTVADLARDNPTDVARLLKTTWLAN